MAGRALPALDCLARELSAFETAAVEVHGKVLGHQAEPVALRLDALLRLAPVGLVRKLASLGQIFGKAASRRSERGVGFQVTEVVLLAENVGHLDDCGFGLGQIWEHG